MKLTNLQKHYNQTFKKLRRYTASFKVPTYKPEYFQTLYHRTTPNKLTQMYANHLNSEIIFNDGSKTEHNIALHHKCSSTVDITININGIPCLCTFSNYRLTSIYIGYEKYDFNPLFNYNSTKAYSATLQYNTKEIKFVKYPMGKHSVLNIDVLNEHVYDRQYSEEVLFQLELLIPNPEVYIEVYKRAVNIIQSTNDDTSKLTVLQLLHIVNNK